MTARLARGIDCAPFENFLTVSSLKKEDAFCGSFFFSVMSRDFDTISYVFGDNPGSEMILFKAAFIFS